jgi:hypothetical protein
LKIRKVDGYWNYDKSEFDRPEPLLNDDEAMEAIWKKEYSLNQLIAPTEFKTYEELEKRLKYVLGQKSAAQRPVDEEVDDEDNSRGSYTPNFESRRQTSELPEDLSSQLSSLSSSSSSSSSSSYGEDEDDDAMSYFQKLAES